MGLKRGVCKNIGDYRQHRLQAKRQPINTLLIGYCWVTVGNVSILQPKELYHSRTRAQHMVVPLCCRTILVILLLAHLRKPAT